MVLGCLHVSFRVNGPECAGVLSSDLPETSVRDGQLAINRRFGRKQPYTFPGLDSDLLIFVPAGTAL